MTPESLPQPERIAPLRTTLNQLKHAVREARIFSQGVPTLNRLPLPAPLSEEQEREIRDICVQCIARVNELRADLIENQLQIDARHVAVQDANWRINMLQGKIAYVQQSWDRHHRLLQGKDRQTHRAQLGELQDELLRAEQNWPQRQESLLRETNMLEEHAQLCIARLCTCVEQARDALASIAQQQLEAVRLRNEQKTGDDIWREIGRMHLPTPAFVDQFFVEGMTTNIGSLPAKKSDR